MTALVDTGVFFAFYSLRDEHHLDSLALVVHLLENKWGRGYVTAHILDETLTLLKYRVSWEAARAFIEAFVESGAVGVLLLDEEAEREALTLFRRHADRKGFSYTDATTVVALRRFRLGFLLTFDTRSFSGLAGRIVGPGYWGSLPEEERRRLLELAGRHGRERRRG
jgi:predicted nucleic acid-binding protein